MPNPNDRDEYFRKDKDGVPQRRTPRSQSRFTRRAEAPKERAERLANKQQPQQQLDLGSRAAHMKAWMALPQDENGLRPDPEAHYAEWIKSQI